MVDVCFGKKDKLNLEEFQKISENKSSDMLLVVLNLLREKLPCSENFYNFQDEFARQMAAEGKAPEQKTKKLASPMMRSLSPTAGSRKGSGDATSTSASVLSKLAGEDSKVNIDKFKSRAEERKKRAAEKDVTVGADPDSPAMSGGDFVRLANRKGAGGANRFASPSHILNPGAERADEETKEERINFEGEMMRKAKESKLKKYWYTLLEKELYVYKHQDD